MRAVWRAAAQRSVDAHRIRRQAGVEAQQSVDGEPEVEAFATSQADAGVGADHHPQVTVHVIDVEHHRHDLGSRRQRVARRGGNTRPPAGVRCRPPSCTAWWCRSQGLAGDVSPASAQCTM